MSECGGLPPPRRLRSNPTDKTTPPTTSNVNHTAGGPSRRSLCTPPASAPTGRWTRTGPSPLIYYIFVYIYIYLLNIKIYTLIGIRVCTVFACATPQLHLRLLWGGEPGRVRASLLRIHFLYGCATYIVRLAGVIPWCYFAPTMTHTPQTNQPHKKLGPASCWATRRGSSPCSRSTTTGARHVFICILYIHICWCMRATDRKPGHPTRRKKKRHLHPSQHQTNKHTHIYPPFPTFFVGAPSPPTHTNHPHTHITHPLTSPPLD